MDKETLSNYGWIVILVLILAVMLALATPFGNFVAGAIKSTAAGLFGVNQNALNASGITIPSQDFDNSENNETIPVDCPIKYRQPYSMIVPTGYENLAIEMCFVFYEDGKATMFYNGAHNSTDIYPMFNVTYYEDKVVLEEIYAYNCNGTLELTVSQDGEIEGLTQGSAYNIPIDIDTSLTTEYPTITSLNDTITMPACPNFKGTIALEFYNLTPSANTDTTKYMWTNNSLFIGKGELTEEYVVDLVLISGINPGTSMGGGFLTSSGFYLIQAEIPDEQELTSNSPVLFNNEYYAYGGSEVQGLMFSSDGTVTINIYEYTNPDIFEFGSTSVYSETISLTYNADGTIASNNSIPVTFYISSDGTIVTFNGSKFHSTKEAALVDILNP